MGKKKIRARQVPEKPAAAGGDAAGGAPAEERTRMVPAVKKMQAEGKKERWQGCCDVAALALEPGAAAKLFACGAVETLAKLLRDDAASVRLAATRALLNLTLAGEASHAETLVRAVGAADLRTLLHATLREMDAAESGGKSAQQQQQQAEGRMAMDVEVEGAEGHMEKEEKATKELLGECAIEYIQLLGAVAYYSTDVVAALGGDAECIATLVQCTALHDVATKQTSLAVAAAELLLLLADDNPPVLHTFRQAVPEAARLQLVRVEAKSPSHVLTKVVLAGALLQTDPSLTGELLGFIFSTVREIKPHETCAQLVGLPNNDEKHSQLRNALARQLALQTKALKTALELLVNLVCSIDADEEDDEEAFARSAMGQTLLAGGLGELVGQKAGELLCQSPNAACETALRDAEHTPYEAVQEAYADTEGAMVVLLSNVLMVVPPGRLGDPQALWAALQQIYARDAALLQRVTASGAPANPAQADPTANPAYNREKTEQVVLGRLEHLCACMWTLLRKGWQLDRADGSSDLEFLARMVEDVDARRRNARARDSSDLVVNVLRLCAAGLSGEEKPLGEGVVGCARRVGQLSMDCLREASLAVNVEAMNCIIDVYSDDRLDEVMKTLNMLQHLLQFATALQAKLSQMQATGAQIEPELEPRLEIVTENIEPFIEYKKERLSARC